MLRNFFGKRINNTFTCLGNLNHLGNKCIDATTIQQLKPKMNIFLVRNNIRTHLVFIVPQLVNSFEHIPQVKYCGLNYPTFLRYRETSHINRPSVKNNFKWAVFTTIIMSRESDDISNNIDSFTLENFQSDLMSKSFYLEFFVLKNEQTNIYQILRKAIYTSNETCLIKHFTKDKNILFQHSREDLYVINSNTYEQPFDVK